MISLFKSERFQKEYSDLKNQIATVTNESIKAELEGLLSILVAEVRSLDSYHAELNFSNALPASVTDSKTRIAEVRKKLDRRLLDWRRANT